MDKTRLRILSEIDAWIKDPDAQPVCWITGMAGTGKTAIAKTVCERASADVDIMLGGSFFCSRTGTATQRDIRCVVPTLAQLLSRQSIEFSRALVDEITRDRDLQHKNVTVQVKRLLYTPLVALKNSQKSVLLIIDALDECGGETSSLNEENHRAVSELLEALVTASPSSVKLPVKFLVTSRPETHIRDTSVSDEDLSQILRLHAVNKEEVDEDIHHYITETLNARLSRKPILRARFTDDDIVSLVRLCDGLFIVAATVLKHTFGAGIDAADLMFKNLLNASSDGLDANAAAPLDRIYDNILKDATSTNKPGTIKLSALLKLLASILCARITLSIAAVAALLSQDSSTVRASLSRLHAIVDVPAGDHEPNLRTVHASFGDYLFSRAPKHIRIARSLGHCIMVHACLDIMDEQLHFNISQSATSYKPNLSTNSESITLALEYACLHWAHHLISCETSDKSAPKTSDLSLEISRKFRPNFLAWLEVLSILHKVGLASGLLLIASAAVSRLPYLP